MGFIGASVGGWVGWYVGASFGMVGAFLVSMIGTGVGMYAAVRWASRYY